MHHVALNRPRPHDRHLDHEIVEAGGFEPWQHAHLRPALDLKHAHRVGPRDHLVDGRVFRGHGGEREIGPAGILHEVERPMDRREHAEGEAVDLQDAEFVEVVLVPLHD